MRDFSQPITLILLENCALLACVVRPPDGHLNIWYRFRPFRRRRAEGDEMSCRSAEM